MSNKYKAGFLGCGNMGGTLAEVCCRAIGGENVAVCDVDTAKTAAMAEKYGATPVETAALFASCDYVFLGVKPQYMASAVAGADAWLAQNASCTVVSMAAGLEVATIREMLGGYKGKLIRIMPNLCAKVGEGMILVCGDGHTAEEIAAFEALLAGAGRFETLPEKLIDAGCAVSGCGPAYVYMFIEAIADAGVECGLSRAAAQNLAAQTVLGAAKNVLVSGGNPGALKDAVCSPAGSTIAGVHALEADGFRAAVMDGIVAAFERNIELKKA